VYLTLDIDLPYKVLQTKKSVSDEAVSNFSFLFVYLS
jgi:hypothetical protein